ncbi:MAG: CZB domain-containing protein [Pseudomonadales bacterium]|nr:CZB domain-containing protein [Pseudomonadales bacterium]
MSTSEEITKAISAHGAWKVKLRNAINTGECESTPSNVKKDNNCSFGKWLYERIDPSAKNSPFYNQARELHADFHKEAGAILGLALGGNKSEAEKRMSLTGDFSRYSAELTAKMKEWQRSL